MVRQKTGEKSKSEARSSPQYLWYSGELVEWDKATVHISMLGWSAISSVFEGIRAYWNPDHHELYLFQLDAHLNRLFQSMKIMRMVLPYSKAELAQAIISLLKANEYRCDTYIQPLAYLSEDVPGYWAVLEGPGELVITAKPAGSNLGSDKVAHCNISSWNRISDNVMPPRAKAITNYQNSRYVSTESSMNGYDYGIILNQDGKVSEAAYACVYIVRNGIAITPPVSAGILESITRDVAKQLLEQELGIPVVERDVERTELYICDEAFLCGTALEIRPIGTVDKYTVGDGEQGPIVTRLKELFHNIVRGVDPRYGDWRAAVYGKTGT